MTTLGLSQNKDLLILEDEDDRRDPLILAHPPGLNYQYSFYLYQVILTQMQNTGTSGLVERGQELALLQSTSVLPLHKVPGIKI